MLSQDTYTQSLPERVAAKLFESMYNYSYLSTFPAVAIKLGPIPERLLRPRAVRDKHLGYIPRMPSKAMG